MSLDDLITLLLVILFVGAPLLRRFLGQGSGQSGGGRPSEGESGGEAADTPAQGRSSTPADARETARAERGEASASRGTPQPESDFERRLEEARRRVQDAVEGRDRSARPDSGRRSQAAPGRRVWEEPSTPLVRPRTEKAASFLGREGTREPRPKTAPLQVSKRRRKRRGSRLSSAQEIVSVRPRDIMKGIVWHQILSEPVSKRPPRRKPSRVR